MDYPAMEEGKWSSSANNESLKGDGGMVGEGRKLRDTWGSKFVAPSGELYDKFTTLFKLFSVGNFLSSSPENRQSQTKWTVKLTWFHNTVCGELEQEATEECLMRYTRGYIMQLIGSILFPDTSDSRVHIRWLPLLEDLDMCGWLSWGLGCVSLMLSWAYHRISLVRPDDFDARRFPLVERWVQYRSDNATGENRLRQYKCTLYKIGMLDFTFVPVAYDYLNFVGHLCFVNRFTGPHMLTQADASAAVVCSLLCFAIVEWHQVDQVVRQFGVLQHIPTRPLNINDMHRLDGTFGCDKWFPQLLSGWHEMWDARADHRLLIYHYIDLRPSLPYMTWYLQWAHTELFGLGDQHLVAARVLDDGHLPELRLAARGGRGRGGGSQGRGRCGRGRGRQGPDEVPRERDPVSTPAHGAEDAGQTVGSVSGPVPGDYCL
ncbi:hypothetical protein Ahy_A09g045572 [Arachis hypogaea]|uniref:Aminotransferase-like plant mobile domain-containing protein n=1 Tax=Arachis hypogaea TaxID=3818 RepID=A0A445BMP1_ARAHY|nr:hypothetical protein Ahy_A09g045572 [Arachis hypogaea]